MNNTKNYEVIAVRQGKEPAYLCQDETLDVALLTANTYVDAINGAIFTATKVLEGIWHVESNLDGELIVVVVRGSL